MNMARGRKNFVKRRRRSGKPTAIVNGTSPTEARVNDREKASGETRGMGMVSLDLYGKMIS